MLRCGNIRFRPAIFILFVFAQFFFKFHKNGDIRKLKDWSFCERMISVDYIMNVLKHSKVRLPFFIHPVCLSIRHPDPKVMNYGC